MASQLELAWANLTYRKTRTAAGVAGVAIAILLLFMQLGFYDSSVRSSTMVFDQLDFDIALRSPQYAHVRAANTLPRRRLSQAEAVAGVARAFPLYVGNATYQEPGTGMRREVVVLGVDPRSQPFALPELSRQTSRLKQADAAIMDAITQRDYEPVRVDRSAAIEDRRVRIAGTYRYGTGLVADASIFVSDETFSRLFPRQPPSDVSIGLAKLEPGADVDAVVSELRSRLPPDVQVLSRRAMEAAEQHTWVSVRPLGIMFTSGVVLALTVGGVIIYQILTFDITHRLRQYATLKAIGYPQAFIRAVVLRQALLYVALAAGPGLLLAYVLYAVFRAVTHLPMLMSLPRIALVLALAVTVATAAGTLAIRRLNNTDPADLFG